MDLSVIKKVTAIIERDATDASYKYALLRSAIEVIQESDHYCKKLENKVEIPIGLLVEKWLFYYFPIFSSDTFLPQKNGETKALEAGKSVAFRRLFKKIIDYYLNRHKKGLAFKQFYIDYRLGRIPVKIQVDFFQLIKGIASTIKNMPMKHIGWSLNEKKYSVFIPNSNQSRLDSNNELNAKIIHDSLGTFTIPIEYYKVFKHLGNYMLGMDAILYKWAQFTVNADKTGKINTEDVLSRLLTKPTAERDVLDAQKFFKLKLRDGLRCVWSEKRITNESNLNIDHVLPYNYLMNNDLWNLLPTNNIINSKKSDKIPSPRLIEKSKTRIIHYWEMLYDYHPTRFFIEMELSLTGPLKGGKWRQLGIENLKSKCNYLIQDRGYQEWKM